jgi:hypothetical protein
LITDQEKLKINAGKVSGMRKVYINQTSDEDCTNSQIDMEECLIESNRYKPCPPPEKTLSMKFKKLYDERMKKFIAVLTSQGYKIRQIQRSKRLIENYDEKYQGHVRKFLSEIVEVRGAVHIPQPCMTHP